MANPHTCSSALASKQRPGRHRVWAGFDRQPMQPTLVCVPLWTASLSCRCGQFFAFHFGSRMVCPPFEQHRRRVPLEPSFAPAPIPAQFMRATLCLAWPLLKLALLPSHQFGGLSVLLRQHLAKRLDNRPRHRYRGWEEATRADSCMCVSLPCGDHNMCTSLRCRRGRCC